MKNLLLALLLAFPAAAASPIIPTASGAAAAAASGNVTPALPAFFIDDVIVIVCVSKDNITHSAAAGWTQKLQASNTATTQLSVWWRRAQSGDTGPLVTHTAGSEIICRATGFRNVDGIGSGQSTDPFDVVSGSYTATNASPISTSAVTSTLNKGMVLHVAGAGIGTNAANVFSAPTGASITNIFSSSAGSTTNRATMAMYASLQDGSTAGSTGTAGVAFTVAPATSSGYASALLVLKAQTVETFYFRDLAAWGSAHGLAQQGGLSPAVVRSGSGWTAGTTASGNYSLFLYGTERAAATFGGTAQPASAPTTTDTLRSINPLTGSFASGNWTIALAFRSQTAAYTGRFQTQMRVWRSVNQNCSSATEITSGAFTVGPTTANLSTTVTTATTYTWSAPAITLTAEYLCFQMAAQITSAGGGSTQDIRLMADANTTRFTSTVYTPDTTVVQQNALDATFVPPNQQNPQPTFDESARTVIIADKNPGKNGDLFGLVLAGDNTTANSAWYLVTSSDYGKTWVWRTASNAEPDATTNPNVVSASACQDTTSYDLHHAWTNYNATGNQNIYYNRVTLSYTGGAITGWSWAAEKKLGPQPDAAGSAGFIKHDLLEVIDGNGVHRLMLSILDQPSGSTIMNRLLAAVTTPAAGLAPTAASSWAKITNSATTSAYDVLGAWSLTSATDANAAVNFTSLTGYGLGVHTMESTAAQLAANGDMHFAVGGYYYGDQFHSPGKIWRWRYTVSGSDWVADGAVVGSVVETDDGSTGPEMGHMVGSANYVWFTFTDPTDGFRIDRINSGGTYTSSAITSPDSTANRLGYTAISVSADETKLWAMWSRSTGSGLQYERSGYYNGSAWEITDDSWVWAQNGWDTTSAQGGAVPWDRFTWNGGIGVLGYGFDTYGSAIRKWHIHTTYTPVAAPAGGSTQSMMGMWGFLVSPFNGRPLFFSQ